MIIPYFLPNLGMGASGTADVAITTMYAVMRHFYVFLAAAWFSWGG